MNVSQEKLGTEGVPKLMLSYFATAFVALVLNSVYTLTDTLFVGWGVGDQAMGGVSLVLPFVLVQSAISTALGGGAASLISRLLGSGNRDEAAAVVFHARLVFYATAVAVTIIGFALMEPILKILGADGDLYGHAKKYYIIILAGNIFSTGFSSIIRAEGKALYSMLIWVIPVSINIVLDAVLILGLGMGVEGSAFATVACQFVSFCMSILFFIRFSALKSKRKRFEFLTVGKILKMGLPALVQSGALSVQLLIVNNVLQSAGGETAVVTFAYLNKYVVFASVPFIALMQAIAPVVGYNYGAREHKRVRSAVAYALIASLGFAALGIIFAEAIPRYLMMAFTADEIVIAAGARALRILAAALPFLPVPMIFGAVFQAEGRFVRAPILYAAPTVFMVLTAPLFGRFWGTEGVWWGFVAACALGAACTPLAFLGRKKQQTGNIAQPAAGE